jgi:hypothetical protein
MNKAKLVLETVAGAFGFLLLIGICGAVLYGLEEVLNAWL